MFSSKPVEPIGCVYVYVCMREREREGVNSTEELPKCLWRLTCLKSEEQPSRLDTQEDLILQFESLRLSGGRIFSWGTFKAFSS